MHAVQASLAPRSRDGSAEAHPDRSASRSLILYAASFALCLMACSESKGAASIGEPGSGSQPVTLRTRAVP